MKKLLIVLLFCSSFSPSSGQWTRKDKKLTPEICMVRARNYKRVGWGVLSAGIIVLGIEATKHPFNDFLAKPAFFPGEILSLIGGCCLIRSGFYKRKAITMSAGVFTEQHQGLMLTDQMRRGFPAIGLRLRL